MSDRARLEELAERERPLAPDECAALARAAAEHVDLDALDRRGEGTYELLWRNDSSEGWLNTWWEPRDTGFHDHGGSAVGVYLLEGSAGHETLTVGGPRRVTRHVAGDAFSLDGSGIHRMEHERGAITIHCYSPPLREIGHYEVVAGELRRHAGPADEISPPSPELTAALAAEK